MRPLEIVSLALIALALVLFLVPASRRPTWARWVPISAAAALLLHLLLEGCRWQMDFGYLVGAASLLGGWLGRRVNWHHAITVGLALLGGLALSWTTLLAIGAPMFRLPEPTGPHAVGVARLRVADPSRAEIFTDDPDDHRELMLRVWYPASAVPASERPVAYWDDADAAGPLMAKLSREVLGVRLLDNAFDHYADIPTHSYANAPLITSPQSLPVLVFSHGYGLARATSNTALMEELASRGYIVASVSHTYETPAVVFDDGRVAAWNQKVVSDLFGGQDEAFFERYVAIADPAERDAAVREFLAKEKYTPRSMKVWDADTSTVVDEIEHIASGDRKTLFAGRLDLDRLGVLGMSFGGATAGVFCTHDARCKAGLNLDGFHYGDGMADAVVPVPFMILSAKRAEIPINDFFFRHAAGPAYLAKIAGSTHMNFTDTSISSRAMRWLGGLGEIDGDRMLHITNAYVAAFFDEHLLGKRSGLLEGNSPDYPEVELLSRNR